METGDRIQTPSMTGARPKHAQWNDVLATLYYQWSPHNSYPQVFKGFLDSSRVPDLGT